MAGYRKWLTISPIGLAAIVMALYSHQLVEWNPEQNPPAFAVAGVGRTDENQTSSRDITVNQEVQSTHAEQLITENSQDITTASVSITISGWVGTEFGEIIAGETVRLYSGTLGKRYSTKTGSSGEFIFTDLKPSYDYTLKVSPQGMFRRYVKFPIKLRSGQEVYNIVLESIPLGILTGRIAGPYGRPVSGIELMIKTAEIDSWSTNVITDANGAFSVAGFPKGRFQLATEGQQSFVATGLKFDPDAYEPVNLTFDLGPYNLSGRIYDESGQAFDGAHVFLNWTSQQHSVRIRSTRQVSTDSSGAFRFIGLGPGDHELVVSAWRGNIFGQTMKKTVRQTVNVGVDPEELNVFISTL